MKDLLKRHLAQCGLLRAALLLAFLCFPPNMLGEQTGVHAAINVFARLHASRSPANAKSCAECHSTPREGGSSRQTVMRAGFIVAGKYVGVPDGGILHTINYDATTRSATIYGARVTPNLLGDGYIEAVPEEELKDLARKQATTTQGRIRGEVVYVTPSRGAGHSKVIGRFSWKAQHASILDASADALLHELGVPNRIFQGPADESRQAAGTVSQQTKDATTELDKMVRFIRDTEPIAPDPARSAATAAQAGSKIFDRIGCSFCHTRTLKTAPPGTWLGGSNIVVDKRLGNKEIHPFSDYLLHDIGTGDGIIQTIRPEDYAQSAANRFRTAPLWGLRFRLWLMHDGKSLTYHQAIMRHRGEALGITLNYAHLTPAEQEELRQFLDSL